MIIRKFANESISCMPQRRNNIHIGDFLNTKGVYYALFLGFQKLPLSKDIVKNEAIIDARKVCIYTFDYYKERV